MKNFVKGILASAAISLLLVGCSNDQEAVATIDGEKITEAELNAKLTQQYGVETLDQLVSNKVIELEAKAQGIEVDDAEIEEQYKAYVEMYGSEEQLLQALSSYKMDIEDVKYDIKIYALTLKVMADYVDITDEDVEAYFNDNIETFTTEGQEAPAFADVKEAVYNVLLEERVNEQYGTWIDEKYEQYDIKTTFFLEEE